MANFLSGAVLCNDTSSSAKSTYTCLIAPVQAVVVIIAPTTVENGDATITVAPCELIDLDTLETAQLPFVTGADVFKLLGLIMTQANVCTDSDHVTWDSTALKYTERHVTHAPTQRWQLSSLDLNVSQGKRLSQHIVTAVNC